MDFYELVDQVAILLQQRGKLTYRSLRRQFNLDDEALGDLKDELLFSHPVVDEDGRGLVWTRDTAQEPTPPLSQPEQRPVAQEQDPASYTPQHLAEKVLTLRSALEGERKQVTVLFCDLANSTAIAERIGPEAMHTLLNRFFELALADVHRYEGTINQFLGDGFMALFGAPIAHEDHARRAVLAALGLRRALHAHHAELGAPYGVTCTFRMGLNSGLVVVGRIGDNLRMDYSAIGDTTNLAARMQQMAAPETIQLTEQTYKLITGYFRCDDLGLVEVKGKADPLRAYRVTGMRNARGRIDVAYERGFTRFVGRERELELLRDCFERAKTGHGQAISIIGEAGLGKSRLLYELRQALAGENFTLLEGRCSPYGATTAYLPIADLLKQTFRINASDSTVNVRRKVERVLRWLGVDVETTGPHVLPLMTAGTGTNIPEDTAPEVSKRKTFDALQLITFKATTRQPLVIIIEDLHWADPMTVEFTTAFVERLATSGILLVCTYRPEFVPIWSRKSYHSAISLTRLSRRESHQMLTALLGTTQVQDDLVEMVSERADGVPFFLEELLQTLRETNAIAVHQGQWGFTPAATSLQVPSRVHDILMARIDRLPEGAKGVLQVAAVIGREFDWELIKMGVDLAEQELQAHLATLTDVELLYECGLPPHATYLFKHALTQEVAYDSLLTTRKQVLHAEIGAALETLFPKQIEEHYELIAHHFARSVNAEKAVHYLTLAGKKAARLQAHQQAIAFFQDALSHLEGLPDREAWKMQKVGLLFDLEIVYDRVVKRDEQRNILDQLIRTAKTLDDPVVLSDAYIRRGEFLSVAGDMEDALAYAEQAFSLKQRIGDKRGEIRALKAMGFIHWQLGQYDEALKLHQESLQAHRESGDREGEGLELINLGELLRQRQDYQEAIRCLEEALLIMTEIGESNIIAGCHLNLGNVYRDLGEYEIALQHYHKRHEIALQIGLYGKSADASSHAHLMGMAAIHSQLGNHQEALHYYQQSLEVSKQFGHQSEMAATLRLLAVTHEVMQEFPAAVARYQEALTLSQNLGDSQEERTILACLGDLYRLQLRDFSAALTCYRQSLAILTETGEEEGHLALLKGLGAACWNLGHYEEAAAAFAQALQIVETSGDQAEQAVVRSSLGIVSLNLHRYENALAYLLEGLGIAKAMGDSRAEGYILNALGNVYYAVGNQQMAQDSYQRALQLRRESRDRKGEGWCLHYLGRSYAELGEVDDAREHQTQALRLAEESGDAELQARTMIALSEIYRRLEGRASNETAIRYAREAVELARAKELLQEEIAGLSYQAMALLLVSNLTEALRCSEQAIRLLKAGGTVSEPEIIWLHHARVLRACGQDELATCTLKKAYESVKERLATVHDKRLRESMLNASLLREILAERTTEGQDDAALSG